MAVFIVLWPSLLTTNLKSVIRHNLGHSKNYSKLYNYFFITNNTYSNTIGIRYAYSEAWSMSESTKIVEKFCIKTDS